MRSCFELFSFFFLFHEMNDYQNDWEYQLTFKVYLSFLKKKQKKHTNKSMWQIMDKNKTLNKTLNWHTEKIYIYLNLNKYLASW